MSLQRAGQPWMEKEETAPLRLDSRPEAVELKGCPQDPHLYPGRTWNTQVGRLHRLQTRMTGCPLILESRMRVCP